MVIPEVVCDGRVVLKEVAWDEVAAYLGKDHVTYLKRRRDESPEDFVRRVVEYCERNVGPS